MADFQRLHAPRFNRVFFVPTDTSLAPDEIVEVQLVLTTGELGRHGNATVVASDTQKGRTGLLLRFQPARSDGLIAQHDPERVRDFEDANPTRRSIQSQQIAETIRSEPEIIIEMDPPTPDPPSVTMATVQEMGADVDVEVENAPPAFSRIASDIAPRAKGSLSKVLFALVATLIAGGVAVFFLFPPGGTQSDPEVESPDKRESKVAAEQLAIAQVLSTVDSHIAAGRLTGIDSALQALLQAQTEFPANSSVKTRLTALANTFEKLAASALGAGNLAEAATHFQAVLLADPSRKSAATKMREIEEKILNRQHGD